MKKSVVSESDDIVAMVAGRTVIAQFGGALTGMKASRVFADAGEAHIEYLLTS